MTQPTTARAPDFDVRAYLEDASPAHDDDTPPPTVAFFAAPRKAPGGTWPDKAGTWRHAEQVFGRHIAGPALFPGGSDFAFRYPHGVPWTAFPVLCDPHYKDRDAGPKALPVYDRDGTTYPTALAPEEAFPEIGDIYIVLLSAHDRYLATPRAHQALLTLLTLRHRPVSANAAVHLADEGAGEGEAVVRHVSVAEAVEILTAVARPLLAWRRFHYCYTVNFTAIAGRAFDVATRQAGTPRRFADLPGWQRDELLHFGALQVLFAVRRSGQPDRQGVMPPVRSVDGLYATEGVRPQDGRLQWRGTGKHPSSGWLNSASLDKLLGALHAIGLVDMDAEFRRTWLTPLGERFLALMHPDNEDPDALCRWHDHDQDHGAALDAWQTRFFRKMKTRVNAADGR